MFDLIVNTLPQEHDYRIRQIIIYEKNKKYVKQEKRNNCKQKCKTLVRLLYEKINYVMYIVINN